MRLDDQINRRSLTVLSKAVARITFSWTFLSDTLVTSRGKTRLEKFRPAHLRLLLISVHSHPSGHSNRDEDDNAFVIDDSVFEGVPATRTTATTTTRKTNHLKRGPSPPLATRTRIPKTCNVTICTSTAISHVLKGGLFLARDFLELRSVTTALLSLPD